MALVRYEPWGIGQLQSEINRLFRSFGDWDSSGATAGCCTSGWNAGGLRCRT